MKKLIGLFILASSFVLAQAITVPGAPMGTSAQSVNPQSVNPDPTVTGTLGITFAQKDTKGNYSVGDVDNYTISLLVANSISYHGTIVHTPIVKGMWSTKQQASLKFDMRTAIINPHNGRLFPLGTMAGNVPIDPTNIYHFELGDFAINTPVINNAGAIDSKFSGQAVGKPVVKTSIKNAAIDIIRNIKGTVSKITVTDYDQMIFNGLVLAKGPTASYSEATVSGSLIWDSKANTWHFLNLTVNYTVNGQIHNDTISGDLVWNKPDNYEADGKSSYDSNIRINEPPVPDNAVFTATSDDDLFTQDNSVPGLTGSISYIDVFSGDPKNEVVSSTSAKVSLVGNHLNKYQVMYLTKLLLLVSIVPFND